ncbi:MAG: FAD-dependent thymidylate synthase [Bacillota bacterium]|nr:FAD-dependent thymidylate synthase [Bacillota bacterium]
MKLELLNYTPNGEMTIAQAGKLCYSAVGVGEIKEDLSQEEISKYIEMLIRLGHYSPLEHVSFTFAIEGVSRSLSHQLVRHRIASYSQQSQRYVKLDNFQYIIPPAIEANPKAKEIFLKAMEADQEAYGNLVDSLYEKNYEDFLAKGYSQKKAQSQAEKASIEDARYVFPNACETKIVVTMNVRSLLHFFQVRTCNRAQWEIRNLATEMLKICKSIYPAIFSKAGPGCTYGPCPEGPMTCGEMEKVREKFRSI